MGRGAFNSAVAARTRAAAFILEQSDLLERWRALGGVDQDLVIIRDAGLDAEAKNVEQEARTAEKRAAHARSRSALAELNREHSSILSILRVIRADLLDAEEADDAVRLEQIIRRNGEERLAASSDGARVRTSSLSMEAIRAEIRKDADALLGFASLHTALASRGVSLGRLEQLSADAQQLPSMRADAAFLRGIAKIATAAERAAVAEQTKRWGAVYGLLRRLAAHDARVKDLLRDAARR